MILSPLNYVGNKTRILHQLLQLFPAKLQSFVDVFCGSGIVGLNTKAHRIVLNDSDKRLFSLLEYFKEESLESIFASVEHLISSYNLTDSKAKPKGYYKIHKNEGLSRYNKEGFLRLRDDYNQNPSAQKLFVLILYGFNHFLRFNSKGHFNVPVGKSDFSDFQVKKTKDFISALKNPCVILKNSDFREMSLYEESAFFYFDPPYLITNAPYNTHWSQKDEKDLYEILEHLHSKNKFFALSNVLESNGLNHTLLQTFAQKYNVIPIVRQYNNANYRRKNISPTKEVLITNYKTREMCGI